MILIALIVVVVALIFAIQLFGVVSVLVFPPDAPIPENSTEIRNENISHGVDEWTYSSSLSPCEVITFYEELGSSCEVQVGRCDAGEYISPGYPLAEIATCIGTDEFSIFGRRWEAEVYTRYPNDQETTFFKIQRDMLWTGN